MSYNISLVDKNTGETIKFKEKHNLKGGTYTVGGTEYASLNITYNYDKFYYNVIDKEAGIRKIYGMSGCKSIPILLNAIRKLNDNVTYNYWDATEGNARKALFNLVSLATKAPFGIWQGD